MTNRAFPLDIPVGVFVGDGTVGSVVSAPWQTSLTSGSLAVMYQNSAPSFPLGLYVKLGITGDTWRYVVPYSYIENFVVDGGTLSLYLNLTQAVTVPAGSLVFYRGGGPTTPTTIGPGDGTWSVLTLATSGSISNLGPQQANFVLAGPSTGNAATPTFRELSEADTPYAAPIDSPTFTGSPQGTNAAWPAAYDDPDGSGNYNPGGTSKLATRDLVKNILAGALGNFSAVRAVSSTTQLPVSGGTGILWVGNFQVAQGTIILPALSSANFPDGVAAIGATYSFANMGTKPFLLTVGQGGDLIVWGSYASLGDIQVNPGETLSVTFTYFNAVMQWMVSGGTTLPWADNTYNTNMNSGQETVVPVTAVGKEQIILNGTLIKTYANGVEAPPILALPSNGEWTVINLTTGGVTILIANATLSGATIPLVSGCNTHVATGPYGIQTASGSINGGSMELTAYAFGGVLKITGGQLLYDTLLFVDDPQSGDLTANLTYEFDPALLSLKSGRWTFYNNLQQTNSFTISVADTFGNTYAVPKGGIITVLYLPNGTLVKV